MKRIPIFSQLLAWPPQKWPPTLLKIQWSKWSNRVPRIDNKVPGAKLKGKEYQPFPTKNYVAKHSRSSCLLSILPAKFHPRKKNSLKFEYVWMDFQTPPHIFEAFWNGGALFTWFATKVRSSSKIWFGKTWEPRFLGAYGILHRIHGIAATFGW